MNRWSRWSAALLLANAGFAASTVYAGDEPAGTAVTVEASAQAAPPASAGAVVIPAEVAYAASASIPEAVKAECQLPQRQSELLAEQLAAHGFSVTTAAPTGDGASQLQVEIVAVESNMSAWTGHSKSITIAGSLQKNGQKVGSFVATRGSKGGMFGAYKGACAVLGRCAQALGTDVARWLKAPTMDARLGEAR